MKSLALFLILAFICFPFTKLHTEEEKLVVVGSPDIPLEQVSKRDLANYFLKTKRFWIDGSPIRPIDWMEGQPARNYFVSKILNKTENELIDYWLSQKLSTGSRPPITLNSGNDICQMVLTTPGSISYFLASSPELKACTKVKIIGAFPN